MKKITDFTLVGKKDFGRSAWLRLRSDEALPAIDPGQFAQVLVKDSPSTYLRRPISIHDVNMASRDVDFLVQKVGEGTRHLAEMPLGKKVNVVLPLGRGFSMEDVAGPVLLIGGGIGIAPLYLLAKRMRDRGVTPHLLLGGKTASDLVRIEDYQALGETFVTTEDGSLGEKGFVTQHSLWKERHYERLYVCGPKPMMKAVATIAKEQNLPCEVSLENLMACGLGACLCCVEDTVDGHVCVCKEGPVFEIRRLKW